MYMLTFVSIKGIRLFEAKGIEVLEAKKPWIFGFFLIYGGIGAVIGGIKMRTWNRNVHKKIS